jgi:hypothetical protein
VYDFNTKIITFNDNIKVKDSGLLKTQNKVITHESITKEARGKSADTRMSKETFDGFEEFTGHPKFEYEAIVPHIIPSTKRNKDKLKESIKSTSPRMHRNSTVKNMNVNYVSSNKPGGNISYAPKESLLGQNKDRFNDLVIQKDTKLKKNDSNLPTSKNHRSMLKLHEKGFKKVTSFFGHDQSANNLSIKQQFNLDRTDNILEKYNKGALSKIIETPHTERSNFGNFEPPKLKQQKGKSRYDNEIFSSSEAEEHNKYKRRPSNNSRLDNYVECGVKKSKEQSDIIKSLAKDEFNPFLFSNPNDGPRHGHEFSERVTNKKMLSRVAPHMAQNEKANTTHMKEQLEILKNDRINNKKSKSQISNLKWTKNSTPNVDARRGQELDIV